jgi:NADP-dependent 3-hydroxy acid dehydrogenase YdfG
MQIYEALAGRTAVVTGAASGMGAATARLLAASGASVALVARRAETLRRLADDLGAAAAGTLVAVPADLTDAASVDALAGSVHDAIGPVDLVVNAAGVMLPNPITDGRADEWQRMLETNVAGPLRIVRAFGADLVRAAAEERPADLVTISSVAAHVPIPEYAVYNATKAAVTHLADSLTRELGPRNVRVSNIEPGLTDTELGAHIDNAAHAAALASRFDTVAGLAADDIADVVGFLVSRPRHVNVRQAIVVPTVLPA